MNVEFLSIFKSNNCVSSEIIAKFFILFRNAFSMLSINYFLKEFL